MNWSASASSSSPVLIDEAMAEVAAADALGAFLHGADRHHHAARQQRRRGAGDQQAEHQQREVAQAGVDHRLLRLRRRQLDEHDPVQRRDRRHAADSTGDAVAIAGIDRRLVAALVP